MRRLYQAVQHMLPIIRWLPAYNVGSVRCTILACNLFTALEVQVRQHLASDCVAAFALAVLAAPEAISYSAIAGTFR
jgi:MFS superfamily sulfate permease-like transporter